MENELGKYLTSRMETVWGNTVNDYNKDDNICGIKVYVFLEGTKKLGTGEDKKKVNYVPPNQPPHLEGYSIVAFLNQHNTKVNCSYHIQNWIEPRCTKPEIWQYQSSFFQEKLAKVLGEDWY